MVALHFFAIESKEIVFMLKFLSYSFFIFTCFFHSNVFSQTEEASGYVVIEFAKEHLENRGEDVEGIINPYLQSEIIRKTEGWTIEETRSLLKFLLENIGPEKTMRTITNGFRILDFQTVRYSDFTKMVDLFIEHIGRGGLSVKLLRALESDNEIMPELADDIKNVERLILFIKKYVEDGESAIEIIINNDLSFINVDNLKEVLAYLEEQGFTKVDIVRVMYANLSILNLFISDFKEKINFLLEYGFSKANVVEILETGRLDEVSLNALKGILKHLEDSEFTKTTIIEVVTENPHIIISKTFHTDFSDLKEVANFLKSYVGKEGINAIASENFMFFYNVKFVELKYLTENLEKYLIREMVVQIFYDLSYDRYGLFNTFTNSLKSALNTIKQMHQMNENICSIKLTDTETHHFRVQSNHSIH